MKKSKSIILMPAIVLLALIPFATHAQGVIVQPGGVIVQLGTYLKFTGAPYFVIPDGHFTNNGTYAKAGETVIFSGNGTPQEIRGTQTTNFNNLTIAAGAVVHIPAGKSATVSGTLTNNTGTSGLVIMSDATGTGSLINSTTGVNGTVQRYIAHRTDNNHGWHFLSTPVVSQAIQTEFVPNPPGSSQAFYSWDEVLDLWINTKDGSGNWAGGFESTFIQGKGYLVNYLNDVTKSFIDVLNVSDIVKSGLTRTISDHTGWNLLGNPFTSALIWNTGWTMSYIAAVAKIWNCNGASYSDIPADGIIPATQGFMVQVTDAVGGSLTIPASARTHSSQAWYKSTGEPYIKLKANDLAGQTFQESVITFDAQATVGYDAGFDSQFLPGYAPQFYSVEGEEHLSTNVLPGLDSQTTIPFNFIKTDGADYTIEAVKIENVPDQVYLTDLKTNQIQNLKENNVYSFTSLSSDDHVRFLLSFRPVGIETKEPGNNGIYVYNNTICISNPGESTVEVYNMIGQKMVAEKTHNEPLYQLKLQVVIGYYIVRLTSGQKVYTEKIFVK